jgi:hypothetical protein
MEANTNSHEAPSWVGRTLMAVGISGAAFAALCCVAPFSCRRSGHRSGSWVHSQRCPIGGPSGGVHRSGHAGLLFRAAPEVRVT